MDYDAAEKLSAFRESFMEVVCYHCQQSAEKILKAYAIAQGEPLMKTHDLRIIVGQCLNHEQSFNSLSDACTALNDYATLTRYPANDDNTTEEEMNASLLDAAEILEFTKSKLAGLGYGPKSD
jgi:HEPN domain-containing protein